MDGTCPCAFGELCGGTQRFAAAGLDAGGEEAATDQNVRLQFANGGNAAKVEENLPVDVEAEEAQEDQNVRLHFASASAGNAVSAVADAEKSNNQTRV